jgi:hypothetical protein
VQSFRIVSGIEPAEQMKGELHPKRDWSSCDIHKVPTGGDSPLGIFSLSNVPTAMPTNAATIKPLIRQAMGHQRRSLLNMPRQWPGDPLRQGQPSQ